MRQHFALAAFATAFSLPAAAHTVDIDVGRDTVEAYYSNTVGASADWSVGGLHNRDLSDGLIAGSLLAVGELGSDRMRSEIGIGGKLYYATLGNDDLIGIGLGGQWRVYPGKGPLGFSVYGFYVPEVLTAQDGKYLWEVGGRVEFEVIERTANVYVGYRQVRVEMDNGRHDDLSDSIMGGMRFTF